MNNIITTNALTKEYDHKKVVNTLDLNVPEGSVYGFLGPNGAGKSTTLKMLLGLVKPTGGQIQILGKKLAPENRLEILQQTGSLIEAPAYYGHLSGKENLQIICKLKNVPEKEIVRVMHLVRMENQMDKKVKNYSLGMKQRLGIAAALLGSPRLLLLDEPTNGLDPAGIQEIRELIRSLPEHGITVLVSSHLLAEIDQMATDVGIIDKGQLIFQDSLMILHEHSRSRILFQTSDNAEAFRLLNSSGMDVKWENDTFHMDNVSDDVIMEAVRRCVNADIGVFRVTEQQKSLEDIFLSLTGKQVSL
ncbi:MAG TPA: ATP-binding cassette domain-containing protein [Candidatus Anaerobutyricum faecale]|uniref:ATP-binding cassette domain-containing protein n=1 Tax=Eubacterium sp. An11 TaxID=1965542 RepID=UPI000B36CBC2|nr:ATP-binding cassette domain-containing protein [Eubacterium sp. An11]OUQ69220.1 ABC transporter ATP-binding protein [Eubacterium sp. An11]HJC32218.1 ATP-binding cassette domain-containing protein [Candidatus Anaerobutyricum faecale]